MSELGPIEGIELSQSSPGGPPRVPLVLSVGITGHRSDALKSEAVAVLHQRIDDAVRLTADAAQSLYGRHGDIFAAAPPALRILSPLADGADQMAAEAALKLGYVLHAVLPFSRDAYRATLEDDGARERFDALITRSACTLELPGDPADPVEAYVMTGRATIAHCDLLIAVWDGLTPRGRGGTAEVVELAISRGTPVIHIPIDPAKPARLLWAAFDPIVVTQRDDPKAQRPFEPQHFEHMLDALLLPPPTPEEHQFLSVFFNEEVRGRRGRFEYSLLLAAAGVSRSERRRMRADQAASATEKEWREFREACADRHHVAAPLKLLEQAYSRTDALATHFAQTYRSGHIFNFVLGGVAVCLGLSTFMAPHLQLEFAFAEFIMTLAVIINTVIGNRNEWHRRWLDYRQLAERLRPMRSLKLLGLAAPDPPGTATNPVPRRWIDWYGTGIWRSMGTPSGALTVERAAGLAAAVADYEVLPQVGYHRRHAHKIEKLDQRLEKIGGTLFFATLIVTVGTVLALLIAPVVVSEYSNWATLISAGFPALGTAIFGIRFQGDFGGSAKRSLATAGALEQIGNELKHDVNLSRAADLAEQASRRMLSDLDEWRLLNQLHQLEVG